MQSHQKTGIGIFHPWLYRFALFLTVLTLILILAGGLVTSREAGLAVPDWPLSYGQLMPPMVGNIFWEHGHRMIAGTVGILTLALAFWLQIQETRAWMKKLGWIAFAAVVIQALLGGLTVKFLLPTAISAFHATLAQSFFCLLAALLYFLSPRFVYGEKHSQVFTSPKLFFITTGLVYLQLILGALVRHSQPTQPWITLHILNAFLVILHILLSAGRISRYYQADRLMIRLGTSMGFITLGQFFLGFGAFIFTHVLTRGYEPTVGEIFFTAAHQTTGALILMISAMISLIATTR